MSLITFNKLQEKCGSKMTYKTGTAGEKLYGMGILHFGIKTPKYKIMKKITPKNLEAN
jgi:hypothetical protein